MSPPLSLALGRTPRTEALFAPGQPFALATLPNITRAFAPMAREGRYEVSEMAIATFLMAKALGKDMVLLPVVLSARHPEASLLSRADGPVRRPADLRGKRVGVRAYSQTTGLWLRGILAEAHGLPPEAMRWVTFEDAHVAEYQDPPWAERAPAGADMRQMLLAGELDAAIFGSEGADSDALAPVFPDSRAAAGAFTTAHGFMPVNHLLVARTEVAASRADALAALLASLTAAGCPMLTRAALNPALHVAARFCHDQGLTQRQLSPAEIWAGTPPVFA